MPKKTATSTSPLLGTSVPASFNQIDIRKLQLLDDKKLSELLSIDPRTPAQWRYTGRFKTELPVVRFGRSCRYRLTDAQNFIATHLQANLTGESA